MATIIFSEALTGYRTRSGCDELKEPIFPHLHMNKNMFYIFHITCRFDITVLADWA